MAVACSEVYAPGTTPPAARLQCQERRAKGTPDCCLPLCSHKHSASRAEVSLRKKLICLSGTLILVTLSGDISTLPGSVG